jgi:hypothetical protein
MEPMLIAQLLSASFNAKPTVKLARIQQKGVKQLAIPATRIGILAFVCPFAMEVCSDT